MPKNKQPKELFVHFPLRSEGVFLAPRSAKGPDFTDDVSRAACFYSRYAAKNDLVRRELDHILFKTVSRDVAMGIVGDEEGTQ